tara:strand:- start:649 stop:1362 length:714 start_codon:yes stop_codon:yes gene_type:complete
MGGIFSFLNTFFVGSLLMSVVLVVMMLFQFRQRINHLQEKSETMLQIINSIVEKMNIKEIELSEQTSGGHNTVQEISPMAPMQQIEPEMQPQTFQGFTEIENLKHQDSEGEDEDDDDESDDESGEESENEGEEKSDDEDESEDEDEEDEESKSVDVVAIDEISQVTDIDVTENNEEEQELTLEDGNNEDEEQDEEQEDDNSLAKMTVAQLKDAVRDRGLASNPSKLRKSELIELLTN